MALDRALGAHVQPDPLTRPALPSVARRTPDISTLEDRLGHAFADRDLLLHALTHVSVGPGLKSYQRLEFLGDRVLGLSVGDLLYAAYPQGSEGDLSRRLSELVRKETCAEVAEAWDVGPHVKLGAGEVQAGMRRNRSVLADVCEAIIGAVFLDGGYEAARALVGRGFGERIAGGAAVGEAPPNNPKAALQEWALGRALPTPAYRLAAQTGPHHAPQFRIAVAIPSVGEAEGVGPSKRVAEQDAARSLLLQQGIWQEQPDGGALPTKRGRMKARVRRAKPDEDAAGDADAETGAALSEVIDAALEASPNAARDRTEGAHHG